MELFYITNDPAEAAAADNAGADRIFVDTETIGKAERQRGLNTHLGTHTLEDVTAVKKAVKRAEIMVRINLLNTDTVNEIEQAIEYGADWIMLPMFTHSDEVKKVADIISGRAKFVALVETAAAMARLDDIINIAKPDEIHIGLNDLTISLGLSFLFEPLAYGLIDFAAEKLNKSKIKWGFGGIARIGEGAIPSEMILAEHRRLSSERVILSRAFRPQQEEKHFCLADEIKRVREKIAEIDIMTTEILEKNKFDISQRIKDVTANIRKG